MIDVRFIAAVGLGAALGGICRLLVTQLVIARAGAGSGFLATLFINVSGSFLIGIVIEMAQSKGHVSPLMRSFLATGILGGYTTFSTFSFEALSLATGGFAVTSVLYAIGSVVLGIAGAYGGIVTARTLAP